MFNYEIYDVIFGEFKKSCESKLSDVKISIKNIQPVRRYEIKLLLCDTHEIKSNAMV